MIELIEFDYMNIAVGFLAGIIFWSIVSAIFNWFRKKRKPSFIEMKGLVNNTHQLLQEANENQRKLYKVFQEVERGLK